MGLALCVVSAVIGIGLSCVSPDPDYCETRVQCPYADTPLGPMQLFCHPTRHTCLLSGGGVCVKDDDCPVETPRCDVDTNFCSACKVGDSSDTSCARFLDRPLCGTVSDGSGATQCLACRSNLDCPSTAPICDSQQCRKCTAHSDCEGELNCDDGSKCTDSMVCIGDGEVTPERAGSCAQNALTTGRVVYVNNLAPSCTPVPTSAPAWPVGSQLATPQCTLQHALNTAAQNNRRFIRVLGQGVMPLDAGKAVSDGLAYSFIGAPTKTAPMATVSVRGIALTVSGASSLTIDQLDLTEINSAGTLILCSGNATGPAPSLTVRHSILRGGTYTTDSLPSSGAAVQVTSCTTLLDGNTIGVTSLTDALGTSAAAHFQGIRIVDTRTTDGTTSYLIQNNLIAGNMGVALELQGISSGAAHFVARFNTIVGNGRGTATRSGAVFCAMGSVGQQISHSIIWSNSRSAAENSQFYNSGDCGLKDLAVGPEEGLLSSELKTQPPALDDDFHLKSGNTCCLDQVTPGSNETFPSQDRSGTSRPQGAKWDLGAFELKQ